MGTKQLWNLAGIFTALLKTIPVSYCVGKLTWHMLYYVYINICTISWKAETFKNSSSQTKAVERLF